MVDQAIEPGSNGQNGEGDEYPQRENLRALANLRALELSVFLARSRFAREAGLTFDGARDLWKVLGYDRNVTTRQYREEYARGGIAGRIVDALPNATWRGTFDIVEDDDPEKKTAFEQAWMDLDTRLQIQAKLRRVDILSQLSTYAVLLIGAKGPLDTELPRGKAESLLYLTPFLGGGGPGGDQSIRAVTTDADATVHEFETDVSSPRFGLPKSYQLRRVDVNSPTLQVPVHWTRIIHVAEGLLEDEVYGQPSLERVWNLLADLNKVTGGGAEAFWLRANQGLHMNIDKDMQLSTGTATGVQTKDQQIRDLQEQAEAYAHQQTRWLRTRGVDVQTLGSDVANFASPADAVLTQIAGAKGIPKRILTGSEMGELASSQDRDNWKDQVNGRQTGYAGPYIVRPLIERLIQYGYLPAPKGGPLKYEVKWPQIQVLTEAEKADGALKWAQTNSTAGEPIFTEAETRDHWYGMAPLTPEQRKEIEDRKAEALKQQQALMAPAPEPEEEKDDEEEEEIVKVLEDAIRTGNADVVHAVIGLPNG